MKSQKRNLNVDNRFEAATRLTLARFYRISGLLITRNRCLISAGLSGMFSSTTGVRFPLEMMW